MMERWNNGFRFDCNGQSNYRSIALKLTRKLSKANNTVTRSHKIMENPWTKLPGTSPFVLPDDVTYVIKYNEKAKNEHKLHTHIYPEPFLGREDAPVVVLALNPGFNETDVEFHTQTWFAEQTMKSLIHQLKPYPFLHLPKTPITPGANWWHKKCRPLIEMVGIEAVSENLLCLEFFPYHSKKFKKAKTILPSQLYTFYLLECAIKRGSEIVIMRSKRLWEEAVPKLKDYKRKHETNSTQNPTISPKNLSAGGFHEIVQRLTVGH